MKKTYLILQLLFITSIIYAQDSSQEIVNSIANSSHTPTLIFDPVSGDSLIYYNLCLGDQLSLVADATFPENNTIYTQSLATTEFPWLTNNIDTFSGQEFINTFTTGGIYEIALTATDVNDCENTVPFTIFVSVSSIEHTISSSTHSPTFGTDSLTGDTIIYYDLCIGEEVYYTLHPHREHWNGKKLGLGVSEGAYFYVLDLSYTKLKGVLNLYR